MALSRLLCGLSVFLMMRRPPRSTRTATLCPYTTRFRSPVLLGTCLRTGRGGFRLPPAGARTLCALGRALVGRAPAALFAGRSEEHTSELQSLMRLSYAVFCLRIKHTPAAGGLRVIHRPLPAPRTVARRPGTVRNRK